MFDLKRPCVNCPFRKGNGEKFSLPLDRLFQIRTATAFQCHKTVDYASDSGQPDAGDRPQQCAGLMAILRREGEENQIMQVAGRFGVDLSGVDPEGEAYDSWRDAVAAHKRGGCD